jgi:hypothetical protein
MNNKLLTVLLLIFLSPFFFCHSIETELFLKNNLIRAQPGDYLVTIQNKNYTVLLIRNINPTQLVIEEITVPMGRISNNSDFSWKSWIEKGSAKNTGWLMYTINLPSGTMQQAYSYTKNEWISIPQSQNFLSTLLSLKLQLIPVEERKKIGPKHPSATSDKRPLWEPKLIVEGKVIPDAPFNGWRTRWPKDGSELAGKLIEVYLPKEEGKYPSYFPYWLQIIGLTGKAKVRVVDSGTITFPSLNKPRPQMS